MAKEKKVKKAKEKEPKAKLGIYYLVPDKKNRDWVIKRKGSLRASARFATKEEAEKRLKELSENQDVGYIKHKKDGTWQKK